jgi:hypothetical protein
LGVVIQTQSRRKFVTKPHRETAEVLKNCRATEEEEEEEEEEEDCCCYLSQYKL